MHMLERISESSFTKVVSKVSNLQQMGTGLGKTPGDVFVSELDHHRFMYWLVTCGLFY